MGVPYSCLYDSSIYVTHGWLELHHTRPAVFSSIYVIGQFYLSCTVHTTKNVVLLFVLPYQMTMMFSIVDRATAILCSGCPQLMTNARLTIPTQMYNCLDVYLPRYAFGELYRAIIIEESEIEFILFSTDNNIFFFRRALLLYLWPRLSVSVNLNQSQLIKNC